MSVFSVPAPAGVMERILGQRLRVSSTRIFARMVASGVQALGVGMTLASKTDVALVIPLPVRAGGGDRAVRFMDLRHRPSMFEDLDELFERYPPPRSSVPTVGAAIATYLPTVGDFERLDPRFRVPPALIEAMPQYRDHGFAVFQFAAVSGVVLPMGLRFATRELDRLFFPTVHMHDGRWHTTVSFDHTLYYQHVAVRALGESNDGDRSGFVLPSHSYGRLLDVNTPVLRRQVRGALPNEDTWIATGRASGLLDS